MDVEPKIMIRERVPSTRPVFSRPERPLIILIIYDTQRIAERNEEDQHRLYGTRPMYVPAKYAITYEDSVTDSDIFAQSFATSDNYLDKPIWFSYWRDLPVALQALRERFPELSLQDQVDYTLDWPLRKHVDRRTPGSSIVTPEPPVVEKPAWHDE